MHSSSIHPQPLVKETKVLLAGQATHLSLGCICLVHAFRLDWMDWRNQHQVFHSCTSVFTVQLLWYVQSQYPACTHLLKEPSQPFHCSPKTCKKHHKASEAENFIVVVGSGLQMKGEERHPFLQDETRSRGGGMTCWRGSAHLNPRNTSLISNKMKWINPIVLPDLIG